MSGYELHNVIERMIMNHPMVTGLQSEVFKLRERLDQMERCCVCVKINKPVPEKT
jgi:hypothetical protein